MDNDSRPVLEVRNLTKRFGAILALEDVSLEVARGEVLALLGDNGAGKSTLIKCLSGALQPDEGEILIDGQPVVIDSPPAAREHGIETVYQDLALFDNMNVVQNFYVGRERARPRWLRNWAFVDDRKMAREASELLNRLEVNIPSIDAEVGLMSGGQRQAVACARAMSFGRRIVILDEPTSALGARESANVLRLITEAGSQGMSIILISHNIEQVLQVADRAVVLRQGKKVGEAEPTRENQGLLVSWIVGSTSERSQPAP